MPDTERFEEGLRQLLAKALHTEDATALTELYLVYKDIEHGIRAIKIYRNEYWFKRTDDHDGVIAVSLYRDAIVQFVGAFGSPKRHKLTVEEVYGSDADAHAFHASLREIRDAFAAHNLGPLRQAQAILFLDGDPPAIISNAVQNMSYRGPGKIEQLDSIIQFMELAERYTSEKIERMRSKVFSAARGLSADQLLALPDAEIRLPKAGKLRNPRANYRPKSK